MCSENASLPFSSVFWLDEVISACEFLEAGWFPAHSGNKVKGQELCLNPFIISRMCCGLWHSLILLLCKLIDDYGDYGNYAN